MEQPETAICTFRVKPDRFDSFTDLLMDHWTTLHGLGLVTDVAEQRYIGVDHQGDEPVIVSISEPA